MLAYVLALVIGLGSIAMYMAAFFFPEVHRKEDFAWSAVGLFYALVLWVCAGRITGGVLLGQLASVALLGWFGWQTLTLRRAIAAPEQQTPIPSQDELQSKLKDIAPSGGLQGLQQQLTSLFRKGKSEATAAGETAKQNIQGTLEEVAAKVAPTDQTPAPEAAVPPVEDSTPDLAVVLEDSSPEIKLIPEDVPPATTEEVTDADATPESDVPELIPPNPPAPELVEAAQKSASLDTEESTEDAATPIEEIAPEVGLAPPAEPPGPGDPKDRLAEAESPISIEAVPIDPENPPTPT
jgi:hypothetical protein